jgi:hypothetical protein
MTTNDKTDSAIPSDSGGTASTKTDSTASAKAAAKKRHQQQQQKNPKGPPPAVKKKQPTTVVKSNFEGIASGVNPMKGIVIAHGNGNLAGQFRVFQKKLAGAAADDKAYGLDSAILDLVAKTKTDFVKPKPDPLVHSKLVKIMERNEDGTITRIPTGETKLVCFDPILKEEMDAEYNMDLKIQKSNWNQFERHYEGYYRTAIGNMDDTIIKYCRANTAMAAIEANKDLVGLLLVVRSVCAQNNGAVKVDEEFQNLCTLHSALGYRQKKNISDVKFADQIADRYGSAVFTSGKFAFGLRIYEKVLETYPTSSSTPLTFIQYLQLPKDEQSVIDDLVKERTVARLIVKNSLNNKLREHLVTSYSTGDSNCYPTTISDALSLLSTFVRSGKDATDEDAVVSYHETTITLDDQDDINDDYLHDEIIIDHDVEDDNNDDGDADTNSIATVEEDDNKNVAFDATVMAAIIAEASADADCDQFIGASFGQLQDVEDAYESNEPDLVCCTHVIDHSDDVDCINTTPDNINSQYPNHEHDFEMILYHTSQRVNNVSDVFIVNYVPSQPDMISYQYNHPTPESIIDYSDTMRMKFKLAGIHDSTDLMEIMNNRSDTEAAGIFKRQLNDVDQVGLKVTTVHLLREETIRCIRHANFNSLRYVQMNNEIGDDAPLISFPEANILLHHVVSAVAINQRRRKPNRWVNQVTHKLIICGITNIEQLESKLNDSTLNDVIGVRNLPRLHKVTIHGLKVILGTADFHQGRS